MLRVFRTQIIYLIAGILVAYSCFEYVSYSGISSVMSVLQNISAAIFTIAGIWIAYIYPEAITSFTNPSKVSLLKGTESTRRIESLVIIIFTSASVLVCSLFYNLLYALYSNHPFFVDYIPEIKFLNVWLLVFLCINQIKAMLSVMVNNIKFVERLHRLKTEKEVDDDL
ncbi:hypothetical protein GL272_10710 [Aeromonas veronii]|uniref:hypothetical protein n=1 Tax=Aeromonas veronii TaxID=654 RepID=UPI001C5A6DDA|nr:hypothetical protein [Aeromonas veronii]MBW3777400.1 hypothetical protein [Aeromonas veronii]